MCVRTAGATGNDFTAGSAADVRESLDRVKRAADIAAALGMKVLRIFAGFTSDSLVYGERFDRALEALQLAAEHVRGTGVRLAIETHGGVAATGDVLHHSATVTTRIDTMRKLLESLPAAEIGMNYDPANLAAVGDAAPERWFGLFRDRIILVHLKDFRDVPGGIVPARLRRRAARLEGAAGRPERVRRPCADRIRTAGRRGGRAAALAAFPQTESITGSRS